MKQTHEEVTYNILGMIISTYIVWVFIICFFLCIVWFTKIILFGWIGIIVPGAILYFRNARIRNLFTSRCLISFDSNGFFASLSGMKSVKVRKVYRFEWADVLGYNFFYDGKNMSFFNLYLRKGTHKQFGFIDATTEDEFFSQEGVLKIFKSQIDTFNLAAGPDKHIGWIRGFFAEKGGFYFLWVMALLILLIFIVILRLSPVDSPYVLILFGILLALIMKRAKSISIYKRVIKDDYQAK